MNGKYFNNCIVSGELKPGNGFQAYECFLLLRKLLNFDQSFSLEDFSKKIAADSQTYLSAVNNLRICGKKNSMITEKLILTIVPGAAKISLVQIQTNRLSLAAPYALIHSPAYSTIHLIK